MEEQGQQEQGSQQESMQIEDVSEQDASGQAGREASETQDNEDTGIVQSVMGVAKSFLGGATSNEQVCAMLAQSEAVCQ